MTLREMCPTLLKYEPFTDVFTLNLDNKNTFLEKLLVTASVYTGG